MKLLTEFPLGRITLRQRVVMAPMTRCRALGNVPNDLMAEYYGQRAGAGLIITEGTSPSPDGLGYARMPGLFNEEQVQPWKKVTQAVHDRGGRIFVQLMHAGRVGHPLNLPEGARLVAPSAVAAPGPMWTDSAQMQEIPEPHALSTEEVAMVRAEFVRSAELAMAAGFDGVELHGANGYLLEQFLNPHSNQRVDSYGGSVENRCRFVLETAAAVAEAIGADRTAIRFSPYGVNGGMSPYPEVEETYALLARELGKLGIAYIHIADHSPMGAPEVPMAVKHLIRKEFGGPIIACGGYAPESAEDTLQEGWADLIAFGRPWINNPDLVDRIRNGHPLATELNPQLFYAAGPEGYTDYPAWQG